MKEPEEVPAPRLEDLAGRLDCFTEHDLLVLANVAPTTVENWRRRGEGPAYAIVGNRVLYPRAAVAQWVTTRMRERAEPAGRHVL